MDKDSGVGHYATAGVGLAGELRTAKLMGNPAATVMHDLYVPDAGRKANIDHLVIAGNVIWIIDSKVWKPGFYWTFGGKTRRGFERFTPAEKRTMEMARDRTQKYLARNGIDAKVVLPSLVVWPSSKNGKFTSWALSIPGAEVITPTQLEHRLRRFAKTPADPRIVMSLSQHLVTKNRSRWN